MERLVGAYISGVAICVVSEFFLSNGNVCLCLDAKLKCFIVTAFMNVYGLAAILISSLSRQIKRLSWYNQFSFIFILVSLLEYLMFNVYMKVWKDVVWNYPPQFLPLFNGRISVVTSFYFTMLMLFFLYFIDPKL